MADFRGNQVFPPPSIVPEPRGYALSGKIMLSAIVILFAVVIIMVCLHVYARWYLLQTRRRQIRHARRRTHLVFYVEPSNPASIIPIPSHGLDAFVLKSLPTFVYEAAKEEAAECAVCLSEFEEGEIGRILPKCNHSFHIDCIDMWFHSHSTCPLCRSAVDEVNFLAKDDVVVELTESTRIQLGDTPESVERPGPSEPELVMSSSSVGGRRKGLEFLEVPIEVPRRSQSFTFTNSDESGTSLSPGNAFKSPANRILSLKRMLSRDKRSPLPSQSPSVAGTSRYGGGESAAELDVELGLVESASQSQTSRR